MGRSVNGFNEWSKNVHQLEHNKTPEEKLFTAILSQAVRDAVSTHVDPFDRRAAQHFLTHNNQTFRVICEGAGRDPEYIMRKVQECTSTEKGWNIKIPSPSYYQQGGKKRGPKRKRLNNVR